MHPRAAHSSGSISGHSSDGYGIGSTAVVVAAVIRYQNLPFKLIKGVEEIGCDFDFLLANQARQLSLLIHPPRYAPPTTTERGEVIGLRKARMSYAVIGYDLDVNRETVRKVWNYYETTGKRKPPPQQRNGYSNGLK